MHDNATLFRHYHAKALIFSSVVFWEINGKNYFFTSSKST